MELLFECRIVIRNVIVKLMSYNLGRVLFSSKVGYSLQHAKDIIVLLANKDAGPSGCLAGAKGLGYLQAIMPEG